MQAVLPRIAACSASGAATIKSKMDSSVIAKTAYNGLDANGFNAVKAALEPTYSCLGITCADVSSMVDPDTSVPLWQPCSDAIGGSGGSPCACTTPTMAPVIVLSIVTGIVVTLFLTREFQGRGAEVNDRV